MRLLLILAVLLSAAEARAQARGYEVIRVDAGFVGGYSEGIEAGGFGIMLEPKYLVTDNIGVGLRLEGMVTFGARLGDDEDTLSSGSVGVVLAKVEYLLGTYQVRPLAGLAAGLYSIGGERIERAGVSARTGRYFGVGPQVGLELGRARLAITYHAIFGADIEVDATDEDFSQDYYAFELSFHFGGSRLPARPSPN